LSEQSAVPTCELGSMCGGRGLIPSFIPVGHIKQGGVVIFALESVETDIIDLSESCRGKDFEICAIKLRVKATKLSILCTYRSPSGDFSYFLKQLEWVLNKLHKISTNIILCGDFNVNFLDSSSKAPVLESLLTSFGLEGAVEFPIRVTSDSQTLIDNIFLDKNSLSSLTYPFINGISDHEGQLLILPELTTPSIKSLPKYKRVIIDYSVQKFITALSQENWDIVFSNHNINAMFNCFSDIYLKIFQACFLTKLKRNPHNPKPWLTQGIKTSCYNKRKLYQLSKLKKDCNFTLYFNRYSKLLKSINQRIEKKIL